MVGHKINTGTSEAKYLFWPWVGVSLTGADPDVAGGFEDQKGALWLDGT